MKEIKGFLNADGLRVGIVVSRFNEFITENLLKGAVDAILRHGAKSEDIKVVWVPGAFEIPLAAKLLAESNLYDAVICLGAVIKGATAHFDFVAGNAVSGISQIALDTNIPVIFGILTTDTIEQTIERAGTKSGNKGYEAAVTAIEMASIVRQLEAEMPLKQFSCC